jgi:hypothetical protein
MLKRYPIKSNGAATDFTSPLEEQKNSCRISGQSLKSYAYVITKS